MKQGVLPARAAITKYQTVWLQQYTLSKCITIYTYTIIHVYIYTVYNIHLFLMVLEAGTFKTEMLADLMSG